MFSNLRQLANNDSRNNSGISCDLYDNDELSFSLIKDYLRVIEVSKLDRFVSNTGSKGFQSKWVKDGLFIKVDLLGYESIAEILVSWFGKFIKSQFEILRYYPCIVIEDGVEIGFGCYSELFTKGNQEVTVAKLLQTYMKSFSIDYDDLRDFLWDIMGYNQKEYIDFILGFDSIIKNDDRHFRNISYLWDGDKYSYGVIFDNGSACLSDLYSYPMSISLEDNIKNVFAKPFKVSFKEQLKDNKLLLIEYDKFIKSVICDDERLSRAYNTIVYGLNEMEGIAWKKI